jgi:hypothetical protein
MDELLTALGAVQAKEGCQMASIDYDRAVPLSKLSKLSLERYSS